MNQPGEDTIMHAETDSAYFILLTNGVYLVQLTLTKGDLSSKDYQNIDASGPMVIPVYVLSDLDGQNFEEEKPGTYIELYESTYSATKTKNPLFSDMGIPYRVTGILTFNKNLGITKGVEMYFDQEGEAWAFICPMRSISSFSITLRTILLKQTQRLQSGSGWMM